VCKYRQRKKTSSKKQYSKYTREHYFKAGMIYIDLIIITSKKGFREVYSE
jgi:hypothetical protein